MLRTELAEALWAKVRDDVAADGVFVAPIRERPDARPRHVSQPAVEELADRLPLIGDERPVFSRLKLVSERVCCWLSSGEGLIAAERDALQPFQHVTGVN